jgi:UMF1 family MFS transporter
MCAPILGAIADRGSTKKKFLFFFAYMGSVMTTCLFMVSAGNWPLAILLYVFGAVGFSGGNVFYDALITSVTSEDRYDVISCRGFALGYLGGGLLFAMNVFMYLKYDLFWFETGAEAVRFSFLTVGVWWAVFTLPIMLFVKEEKFRPKESGLAIVRAGLSQLRKTFGELRRLRTIFLFLIAYWFYMDGVDTVIRMAVDYGLSLGFGDSVLITALLITQFVGFPSAIGFGFLGKKIGPKRGIYITLIVYMFVCVWGAMMQREMEFYLLAIVVGTVQGGVQALSRSFFARMVPADKSAEYFGFYNMLGKFAVVLGPIMMGGLKLLARDMGFSGETATRLSISAIAILIVAGGVLLTMVNEEKGKRELEEAGELA